MPTAAKALETESVAKALTLPTSVAVIVQVWGALGAVKIPLLVIVPQLALQLTREFAVNSCEVPAGVCAFVGVTTSGTTDTFVSPVAPDPFVDVAVTLALPVAKPAVKSPEVGSIAPAPVADQVTGIFAVN